MATAVEISRRDMHEFLAAQGFTEMTLQGTKERVYGKVVDAKTPICLRVYTSVEGESTRGVGEDAIRCVLVTKVGNEVKIIGSDKRVQRVAGWKANLQNRLDNWRDQLGPACPKCAGMTTRKRSRRGPFWGCCKYPVCQTVQPIETPTKNPLRHQDKVVSVVLAGHAPIPTSHMIAPVPNESDEHINEAMANALRERIEEKAVYARLEAEQERKAYMDEMDAELRAELRANGTSLHR
jgi:ssDNA-binding Zn-finger/Zn-ribbon topoisomerase 1